MPHTATPPKPAPSSRMISSKCSTGTALVFATPWISTNWASTNLTWLVSRKAFAASRVIPVCLADFFSFGIARTALFGLAFIRKRRRVYGRRAVLLEIRFWYFDSYRVPVFGNHLIDVDACVGTARYKLICIYLAKLVFIDQPAHHPDPRLTDGSLQWSAVIQLYN